MNSKSRRKPDGSVARTLFFDDAALAPHVRDITEVLDDMALLESMFVIAEAVHDLFDRMECGAKVRAVVAIGYATMSVRFRLVRRF